jgi:hypothetical protein
VKRKRDRSKEVTCFCDAKPWPHRAHSVEDCQYQSPEQRESERENAYYYRGWRYQQDREEA